MNQRNFENINNMGHESIDSINELGHRFFGELINVAIPIVNNVTNNNINCNNKITIKTEIVEDSPNKCIIHAYMPGVEKEQVNVNIKGDNKTLVLDGITSLYEITNIPNKLEKKYHKEINTGIDINNNNLDIKCIAGVLKITINKTPNNRTKVNIN